MPIPVNAPPRLKLFGVAVAAVLLPFALFGPALEARVAQVFAAEIPALALAAAGLLAVDGLLPIPSSVVAAGAATRLDPATGVAAIALGTFGSATICYALGRALAAGVPALVPPRERAQGADATRDADALLVFATRGVPVLAETTAIMAGATCPWPRFLIAAAGSSVLLGLIYVVAVNAGQALFGARWTILAASVAVPVLLWLAARLLTRGRR